jgi:hypothetical protein
MLETFKIMKVHVYETYEFEGVPTESEEMTPRWFSESEIPLREMWPDDEYWFPYLLQNKAFIGRFEYEDEVTITDYTIREQI